MKKAVNICTIIFFLTLNYFFTPLTYASEVATPVSELEITKVEVNEKMLALDKELNSANFRIAMQSKTVSSEEIMTNIMLKYDGAEVTYTTRSGSGWSERLVNGGYNVYATSRNGLANVRNSLGLNAMGFRLNGILYGAMIGGVLGAVVGFFGSSLLASRLDQGAGDIKLWINRGRSAGGARMTVSAHFPINNINSTTQATV
ncbi:MULTISPECIES: glycine zipper family protein [unclassified Enterococcus]|uniref:glycine zipper family protein n=1 Tax=unclassified Enterococcus TaxID=2608891 RepID=UPI0013ED1AD5|nr:MULTISPECIES: glycine zipper family protein [unclassified Enterococcus]